MILVCADGPDKSSPRACKVHAIIRIPPIRSLKSQESQFASVGVLALWNVTDVCVRVRVQHHITKAGSEKLS